ncbi:MAG TPA: hypothetical protein PKZ52_11025, partial [Cellvibrionaceae bacterium]|nr:hypothetical protein [Cellvibrionaceae bacterium]
REIDAERRDLRDQRRDLDDQLGRFDDGRERSFWYNNREYLLDERGYCYRVTRSGNSRRMSRVSSSYCR